jgi:hypothetical protein
LDDPLTAVPLGEPHPDGWKKNRAGLYASKYTKQEDLSAPQEYIVRVDYAAPLVFPFSAGVPWTFSFSPGFGTRRANSVWTDVDPDTGVRLPSPIEVDIGPREYSNKGEGQFIYRAVTSEETYELRRLGTERRIEGADVTFPIGSLSLSKTLNFYPEALHEYVLSQRNKTNSFRFLGRPPGMLKFVGPSVTSRIGQGSRLTVEGIVWQVDLLFEDNDEGSLITVQDTFIEQKTGEQVAIKDTAGTRQLTHYKYYHDVRFDAMISVLEAYA